MGFIYLCGAPSITYQHESNNLFWDKLIYGEENKYMLTAATTNDIQ